MGSFARIQGTFDGSVDRMDPHTHTRTLCLALSLSLSLSVSLSLQLRLEDSLRATSGVLSLHEKRLEELMGEQVDILCSVLP